MFILILKYLDFIGISNTITLYISRFMLNTTDDNWSNTEIELYIKKSYQSSPYLMLILESSILQVKLF